MLNKRGQGLSITTIIVAVIALIVLVVLIAILTGRLGAFSEGISETTSCSQICKALGYEEGRLKATDPDAIPPVNHDEPIGARDGERRQCLCRPSR